VSNSLAFVVAERLHFQRLPKTLLLHQQRSARGAVTPEPLQCTPHRKRPDLEVNVGPLEAEHLAAAQAATKRHCDQPFEHMLLRGLQQLLRLLRGERLNFVGDRARASTSIAALRTASRQRTAVFKGQRERLRHRIVAFSAR
jgi:hypothetical protein